MLKEAGSCLNCGPMTMDDAGLGEAATSSIDPLLQRLARGEFDLVGIGRASVARQASLIRG